MSSVMESGLKRWSTDEQKRAWQEAHKHASSDAGTPAHSLSGQTWPWLLFPNSLCGPGALRHATAWGGTDFPFM